MPPYNQPALKLLIVGCGRVGSQLASDMDKAGHEVVIIDRDGRIVSVHSGYGEGSIPEIVEDVNRALTAARNEETAATPE